jgi:predicted TPR repeat methyltransferase
MTHMGPADFEVRYRADPDPWSYESSRYERDKYDATLRACGSGPFTRALELGSSIGVLSARLADRCHALVTLDAAATAVATARRRLAGRDGVTTILGEIPAAIPDGPYDLVLASEILYYLDPEALRTTLVRLREVIAGDGRLVAVHWRPAGPERPFTAAEVHAQLHAQSWLRHVDEDSTDAYLLDVWEPA